jgi:hypothetical protein
MSFRLIEAERAEHPVSRLCQVLGVTGAGYYAWKRRAPSRRAPSRRALADRELRSLIARVFRDSRETYGAPRIQAELADEHDIRVSQKRVARLMRELGIVGVSRRRKGPRTTVRAREAPAAADLVRRDFRATGPDRLWVADITYVPTWEGYVFLACVLLPGGMVVGLCAAVAYTFGLGDSDLVTNALAGVALALFAGLFLLFLDIPSRAAVFTFEDPLSLMEEWDVRPSPRGARHLNVYYEVLDTEVPAGGGHRALGST